MGKYTTLTHFWEEYFVFLCKNAETGTKTTRGCGGDLWRKE
jgi:hypothetical protein